MPAEQRRQAMNGIMDAIGAENGDVVVEFLRLVDAGLALEATRQIVDNLDDAELQHAIGLALTGNVGSLTELALRPSPVRIRAVVALALLAAGHEHRR
jgi:hypothetical protein